MKTKATETIGRQRAKQDRGPTIDRPVKLLVHHYNGAQYT